MYKPGQTRGGQGSSFKTVLRSIFVASLECDHGRNFLQRFTLSVDGCSTLSRAAPGRSIVTGGAGRCAFRCMCGGGRSMVSCCFADRTLNIGTLSLTLVGLFSSVAIALAAGVVPGEKRDSLPRARGSICSHRSKPPDLCGHARILVTLWAYNHVVLPRRAVRGEHLPFEASYVTLW